MVRLKLFDPLHGFPDCLQSARRGPTLFLVRHVRLRALPPLAAGYLVRQKFASKPNCINGAAVMQIS